MLGSAVCGPQATCENTVGSYRCTCDIGFTGNGTICTGIVRHNADLLLLLLLVRLIIRRVCFTFALRTLQMIFCITTGNSVPYVLQTCAKS